MESNSCKRSCNLSKKSNKSSKSTSIKTLINIDYHDDSTRPKRLSYFPYIQLGVMLLFLVIAYFALMSSKKAEQNKVWVGLSEETAHQLGTPISSLMAWLDMLEMQGTDSELIADMGKDVHRLSVIAERFSKIGSQPEREPADVTEVIEAGGRLHETPHIRKSTNRGTYPRRKNCATTSMPPPL